MVLRSNSNKLAAACLVLTLALPATARADLLEPFSSRITALTGDWEAEDWDDGELKLHPDMFTWQSDLHITLRAAELPERRSLMDIARYHFDGFDLDDDTLEPTIVNMDGADTSMPGLIIKPYRWYYVSDNLSMFGVIQQPDGMVVPYHTNCEFDDERYDMDRCTRAVTQIMAALNDPQAGLRMPDPPDTISVPYWSPRYDASGTTVLSNSNFHGTVNARVVVTAPEVIPPDALPDIIEAFSEGLVDEFDDQTDKHPGIEQWVGSNDDRWFRRDFPKLSAAPHPSSPARRRRQRARPS